MAKKKILADEIVEIKKALEEDKLIIGTSSVMNALRLNSVTKVFLSSNCPEDARNDIEHMAGINNVAVIKLKQANDELGVVCKKPFSISILAIKNE